MRFASLGSGSDGNSLLIAASPDTHATRVMVDCGFGLNEAVRRLAKLGVDASAVHGIVVTHEHSDHLGGVFKLARRYSIPVWLTHGSFAAAPKDEALGVDVRICRDAEAFAIGDIEMTPFTVPHDAREPVQYVASNGLRKLGVLTDVGQSTPYVLAALAGCDALLLEFNHDSQLLADSVYPAWLKARIAGPMGHLSNAAAADLLGALDKSRMRTLVAAHLSQKNNSPERVRAAIDAVIGGQGIEVVIAEQDAGFGWVEC